MDCSIIIPARNEEDRILPTLSSYIAAFDANVGRDYEIIVVANDCSDRTIAVVRQFAITRPQIRVMDIPQRIGKGGAILAGFRQARGNRIAFADADGSVDASSLLVLLDQLADVDVAIGSRHLAESTFGRRQSPWRRAAGHTFRTTVRRLFALPFADTQCGGKAFRREAARALAERVTESGWAFDIELLLAARSLGFSTGEYAVHWSDSKGSQLQLAPALPEITKALWRLARRWSTDEPCGPSKQPIAAPDSRENALRILAVSWRCIRHPQAGGSEVNLFEQASRWVANGHRVTIFCAGTGRGWQERHEVHEGGVKIIRRGNHFTVYLHAALYLLTQGHRYDRVLDVMNGLPFFTPIFTDTPSTLLIHHVQAGQWFSEASGLIAHLGWWIEGRVAPFLYRHHPIITVSPTTRDALVALGYPAEHIHIVYNGISGISRPLPISDLNGNQVKKAPRRIVYVGRLKRYKRIDLLVRAAAELKATRPDLLLDIAGDGDQRGALVALIKKLGLGDWVTVHGPVDEDTKANLLSAGTVFGIASMQEGWGLTVLEANLQGCPAVAYNVPGLSVAIRHGETGLLAADDRQFVHALAFFLDHADERARFALRARQWAQSFSWDSCASETLAILRAGRPEALLVREAIHLDGAA